MISRPFQSLRRHAARLVSLLLIFGLCAGHVPLVHHQWVDKDRSDPFPCQFRACGCRSASHCWTQCCCFSNAEKLAWGEKNRVAVPLTDSTASVSTKSKTTADKPLGCCTTAKFSANRSACCVKLKASPVRTRFEVAGNERVRVVTIAALAQDCGGGATFWISVPWSLLPARVAMAFLPSNSHQDRPADSYRLSGERTPPPVPPPRFLG